LVKQPITTKDYTYDEKLEKYSPLLEVQVGTKDVKKPVLALIDTGCGPDMSLCRKYIERNGITLLTKMNNKPIPVGVADGHSINADYFKAVCEINGKERTIEVCVIDPEKFFSEKTPEINETTPLLGRGVLQHYDIMFEGKNKKFSIYEPDLMK
jgi:hypothetical protein